MQPETVDVRERMDNWINFYLMTHKLKLPDFHYCNILPCPFLIQHWNCLVCYVILCNRHLEIFCIFTVYIICIWLLFMPDFDERKFSARNFKTLVPSLRFRTPWRSILKKYHVFAPMGRFQLELIYLYFPPSSHLVYLFLSCRPFVVITTLSTGLVGVEVTSVSWLGQLTVGV